MDRKLNRVITLFLSLWIGLAPAVLIAPATAMTLQMAEVHDTKPNDCDCCPEPRSSYGLCMLMCANVPLFVTAPSNGLIPFALDNDYSPELEAMMMGWIAAPDLPPPRRPALA
jgi:hypothetical protein